MQEADTGAVASTKTSSGMDKALAYVKDSFQSLRNMDKRQAAHQVLSLLLIGCSAIMIWKGLIVVTGSESPVVVVLSGSMEPVIWRGDILFLYMGSAPFRVGEIVVYKVKGRDIPIVHRIIEVHDRPDGEQEILTKGDNNDVDDRGLYVPGNLWLTREEILGRAKAFLPYVGFITIKLTEYPLLKYAIVGIMGIFVLSSNE